MNIQLITHCFASFDWLRIKDSRASDVHRPKASLGLLMPKINDLRGFDSICFEKYALGTGVRSFLFVWLVLHACSFFFACNL